MIAWKQRAWAGICDCDGDGCEEWLIIPGKNYIDYLDKFGWSIDTETFEVLCCNCADMAATRRMKTGDLL